MLQLINNLNVFSKIFCIKKSPDKYSIQLKATSFTEEPIGDTSVLQ